MNIQEYVTKKIIEYVEDERVTEIKGTFSFVIHKFNLLTVKDDEHEIPIKLRRALENKFGTNCSKYFENSFVYDYSLHPFNFGEIMCKTMIGFHPSEIEIFTLHIDEVKIQVMYVRYPCTY